MIESTAGEERCGKVTACQSGTDPEGGVVQGAKAVLQVGGVKYCGVV